jgi:hypothetical protein
MFFMQSILLALTILLLTTVTGVGQCNRKVNWHAAKAELLDENGQVVDTKEGAITMTTDKSTIKLSIKEKPNKSIEGTIRESNCDWKEVFKNGKTVYKAEMRKTNSDNNSNGTFTIEAKDGKITILMEVEKMQGKKIRIPVDKYEEADNDLPVPRSIIDISTI